MRHTHTAGSQSQNRLPPESAVWRLLRLGPEGAAVRDGGLAAGGVAQHGGAAGAHDRGLGMGEDRGAAVAGCGNTSAQTSSGRKALQSRRQRIQTRRQLPFPDSTAQHGDARQPNARSRKARSGQSHMEKQPGQRTSMKKELGDCTRRLSLCLRFSAAGSGWRRSTRVLACGTEKAKRQRNAWRAKSVDSVHRGQAASHRPPPVPQRTA